MSDNMTATVPTGADDSTAMGGTAFSYCCECGTYDAHTAKCTCCGYDFRVETRSEASEP